MALWQFNLNDDEDLVVDQKPHWIMLAAPTLQSLFFVVVTVLAITLLSFLPSWTIAIPLAILAFLLIRLAVAASRFRVSHLIITSERLIYSSGVLGRKVKEIPMAQISNLTYSQGLGQRMLGFGSLNVEHSGENGGDAFPMVRRPDLLVTMVSSQISRRTSGQQSPKPYSPLDELAKLAALRRAGSITQEEFEQAKARLLDQI